MAIDWTDKSVTEQLSNRLGEPEAIAEAAVQNARREPILRRRRWVVLAMAPLPTFLVALVVYMTLLWRITSWWMGGTPGANAPLVFIAAIYGLAFFPATMTTCGLAWMAARARLGLWWWAAAAAVPVLFTAHFVVVCHLSHVRGRSSLTLNLTFPPTLEGAMQALVPLVAGGILYSRLARRGDGNAHRVESA